MRVPFVLALAGACAIGGAGCGSAWRPAIPSGHSGVGVPADRPPSPATWPAYPRFSRHSCWTRPFLEGETPSVERVAPSYAPAPRAHPLPPATVAKRLLARLGDRRYVRAIRFAPAPAAVGRRVHVLYAGGHPPADALTATVVSSPSGPRSHATPAQILAASIASWESGIVVGALRDDMCAAGGAPLVSWTSAGGGGFSESGSALEQRFPNPAPAAFRQRVELVGRRYGFRIASLRLLRPRQLAPLLVVETDRNRKAFSHDIPAIMRLLDPTTTSGSETAQTFEAFFFAAEDAHGPFVNTEYISRGEAESGESVWNHCDYPYPVLGPVVSSCGSRTGSVIPHRVAPSPTAFRFSAAANRRFARRDVRNLLRIVVLPRNARGVPAAPSGAPSWFRSESAPPRLQSGVASARRIWVVRRPLKSLLRFVQAHARPRPRPEPPFRMRSGRIGSRPSRSYLFPPVPGRSWSRWLTLALAPLPGGSTAVLAEAGDAWLRPSPRTALLPATVRRTDLTSRVGKGRPDVLVHVRNRYDVGWIVALTNALGVVRPDLACATGLVGGPLVTLTFRSASGKVLARATVLDPLGEGRSGPCDPLQLTVRGRTARLLIAADLLLRIQRLLGVNLAPPLPRDVASCLRRHGWTVEAAGRSELETAHESERWRIVFHRTGKVTTSRPAPRVLARCVRPKTPPAVG